MDNKPLAEAEKQIILDAGWEFLNDDYIFIPDDYDGCMAYGIEHIRTVLRAIIRNNTIL